MTNHTLFSFSTFPRFPQNLTTESLVQSWKIQGPVASWQQMGIALFDQAAGKQFTDEAISLYGDYWLSAMKLAVDLLNTAKYPLPVTEMTLILQDSQKSFFEKTAMLRDLNLTRLQSLVGQQVDNNIA